MSIVIATTRSAVAEWSRLWSVRSSWALVLATTAGVLGIAAVAASSAGGTAPQGGSPWTLAAMIGLIGLFGMLVLVAVAAAADYATGSITTSLQWTPQRGVLLTTRILVLTITGVTIGIALLAATAFALKLAAPQLDYFAPNSLQTVGNVALVYVSCSALAVGLSLVTRSTAASLSIGFALMIALPLLLQAIPASWATNVIEALPGAGAFYFMLGEGPGGTAMDATKSAIVLVSWAVVALAAGGVRVLLADADD